MKAFVFKYYIIRLGNQEFTKVIIAKDYGTAYDIFCNEINEEKFINSIHEEYKK